MPYKQEKTASILKTLAAEYLLRESQGPALVTVTGVALSEDRTYATIHVSVFPETDAGKVLLFLRRKRGALRKYLMQKSVLRVIPHLEVAIDRNLN